MPRQQHFYGLNHLHFLTASTYRRARIFEPDRFKGHFIQTLSDVRGELGFKIIGYALTRRLTDCHLLISPSELADPSQTMQKLAERTANSVLRTLRRNNGSDAVSRQEGPPLWAGRSRPSLGRIHKKESLRHPR